jgi:hypothetical protein
LKQKLPQKAWQTAAMPDNIYSSNKKLGGAFTTFALTTDQEMICVYIINTCEYCLDTLPKVHEQIEDTITEAY